jgi:MFS family permease
VGEGIRKDIHIPERPVRPSRSDLWFMAYLPLSLSDGLSSPLIPLVALLLFHTNALGVTVVIAGAALSEVPFTVLWGNLSDRVRHRKYFLVASFAAGGALLVLMALATNLSTFFVLNVFEGLASSASAPVGTMLLLETRSKRWWPRDLGFFGVISGLGTVLGLAVGVLWFAFLPGLAVGGSVAVEAMRFLLGLSGVLSLLAAGLAVLWVEEPQSQIAREETLLVVRRTTSVVERLRRTRRRLVYILELARGSEEGIPRGEYAFLAALFVMSVGFQVFYGPFPVYLVHGAGLTEEGVFLVYLASAVASTALFYHSGLAVEVTNPKGVFIGSLLVRALLLVGFLEVARVFTDPSWQLTASLAGLNAAMGITWAFLSTASTLFLLRLVRGPARGKALGWYNAIAGMGGLAGTLLGGGFYVLYGSMDTFLLAMVAVVVGALILVPIAYRPTPFQPPPMPPIRAPSPRRATGSTDPP